MLNFNNADGYKSDQMIEEIGRSICFEAHSKDHKLVEEFIRVISKDGVDSICRFNERDLVLESYAKLDNYHLMVDNKHNILEQKEFASHKTLSRLINKARNYKTQMTHELNLKNKDVD
jgi:hypothetical protein